MRKISNVKHESVNRFSFYYPVAVAEQTSFDGKNYKVEIPLEGHIAYGGVLLCKQTRNRIEESLKAVKGKDVTVRFLGVKLCPDCLEAYKNHPASDWVRWIKAMKPNEQGV